MTVIPKFSTHVSPSPSHFQVSDLHDALKNKTREVKEMRNAITQAGEVESEHVKARLRAREAELERQKAAYEDARRGFQVSSTT